MDDVRLLARVQRRRKLAWIEASLIHSGVRFDRVTRSANESAEIFRDLSLMYEVQRMWEHACTDPCAEAKAARSAVGVAPGGNHA